MLEDNFARAMQLLQRLPLPAGAADDPGAFWVLAALSLVLLPATGGAAAQAARRRSRDGDDGGPAPLAGERVLDLTNVPGRPLCLPQLAHLGGRGDPRSRPSAGGTWAATWAPIRTCPPVAWGFVPGAERRQEIPHPPPLKKDPSKGLGRAARRVLKRLVAGGDVLGGKFLAPG